MKYLRYVPQMCDHGYDMTNLVISDLIYNECDLATSVS